MVPDHTLRSVEETLGKEEEALQEVLDEGYRDLDRRQPALAAWLASEVSDCTDELAQSVGYFLAVSVFLAFQEAFPRRLGGVDEGALALAMATLEADEELRANDPLEPLESDDVVAMGQPAVLEFVQHHVREAIKQAGADSDVRDFDGVYRAVLVEVIALSHAVGSPADDPRYLD